MNEQLEPEQWASFLQGVSSERHGDSTAIEVLSDTLGDQHEAHGLPLASLAYDHVDGAVIIELSSGDDPGDIVLRRIITSPTSVAASPPTPKETRAIRIENADCVTLVEFESVHEQSD